VSWKIVKNSDFEPFAYDPLKTNNLFYTEETMESQTLTNKNSKGWIKKQKHRLNRENKKKLKKPNREKKTD
jgi:hypothetical protein